MTYEIPIGSVSHGTLLLEDLLTACLRTLNQIRENRAGLSNDAATKLLTLIAECRYWSHQLPAGVTDSQLEVAMEKYIGAVDMIAEHCPPYCYFGMHEGDGSDLGCWLDGEQLSTGLKLGFVVEVARKELLDDLPPHCEMGMITDPVTNGVTMYRSVRKWEKSYSV